VASSVGIYLWQGAGCLLAAQVRPRLALLLLLLLLLLLVLVQARSTAVHTGQHRGTAARLA
jgi:hypothetical protein